MTDKEATREKLSKQGAQISLGGYIYNYKISSIKESSRTNVARQDLLGIYCVPATMTGAFAYEN